MVRAIWNSLTLLVEMIIISFVKTEIHEQLHLFFSKGFSVRTKFDRCDFLPGFTDKLPRPYRVLAPLMSSFWDIAFGLFMFNLGLRLFRSGIPFKNDILILGNICVGICGGLLLIAGGIVNIFPITGDGICLWAIIISFWRNNPLPDVFTNKIQLTKISYLPALISLAAWLIAIYFFIVNKVAIYLILALILSIVLSIINWNKLQRIQQQIIVR